MKKRTLGIITACAGMLAIAGTALSAYSIWYFSQSAATADNAQVKIADGVEMGILESPNATFKLVFESNDEAYWADSSGNKITSITLNMNLNDTIDTTYLKWTCEVQNRMADYVDLGSPYFWGDFTAVDATHKTAQVPLPTPSYVEANKPTNLSEWSEMNFHTILHTIIFTLGYCTTQNITMASNGLTYQIDTTTSTVKVIGQTSNAASVSIPASFNGYPVSQVGIEAFKNDAALTSVYFNNPNLIINNYAFENCTKLATITLPANTECVYYGCFFGCSSLTSIFIPATCNTIGAYAFENCSKLASITGMASVKNIYCGAFGNDVLITSFTLPVSLITVKCTLFTGCTGLTSVNYAGTKTQWAAIGKYDGGGYPDATAWAAGSSLTQVVCTDGTITL